MNKKQHPLTLEFYWLPDANEVVDEIYNKMYLDMSTAADLWSPFNVVKIKHESWEIEWKFIWKVPIPAYSFDWLIKNGYAVKTEKEMDVWQFIKL